MIIQEWHKALVFEAKILMEKKYYTHDQAMRKAWTMNYNSIVADKDVEVRKLREMYWKDGFKQLENYTEEIISRYR